MSLKPTIDLTFFSFLSKKSNPKPFSKLSGIPLDNPHADRFSVYNDVVVEN